MPAPVCLEPRIAVLAITGTLVVQHGTFLFRGYFYWDDLILVDLGAAGTYKACCRKSYPVRRHDDHVMPGAPSCCRPPLSRVAPNGGKTGPIQPGGCCNCWKFAGVAARVVCRSSWQPGAPLIPSSVPALFTPFMVPGFIMVSAALGSRCDAGRAGVGVRVPSCWWTGSHRYAVTGVLVLPRWPAVLESREQSDSSRQWPHYGLICAATSQLWRRCGGPVSVVDAVAATKPSAG